MLEQKIKKMKKGLVYVCNERSDGGAKKRTRTLNSHYCCQLQVKLRAERVIERPVYELENDCQVGQALISSVQMVSFVITGVFAAG